MRSSKPSCETFLTIPNPSGFSLCRRLLHLHARLSAHRLLSVELTRIYAQTWPKRCSIMSQHTMFIMNIWLKSLKSDCQSHLSTVTKSQGAKFRFWILSEFLLKTSQVEFMYNFKLLGHNVCEHSGTSSYWFLRHKI